LKAGASLSTFATNKFTKSPTVPSPSAVRRIDVEMLASRMEADLAREELFVRTLRAAHECSLDEKLVALATALANGADNANGDRLTWEEAFVRALEDCDGAHLDLLRRFAQSPNQLGLGQGTPEFDAHVEQLTMVQITMIARGSPLIPKSWALASLSRCERAVVKSTKSGSWT
jgi:hypothetical protein